jgi:hypothetical protein
MPRNCIAIEDSRELILKKVLLVFKNNENKTQHLDSFAKSNTAAIPIEPTHLVFASAGGGVHN